MRAMLSLAQQIQQLQYFKEVNKLSEKKYEDEMICSNS